MWIKDEEDGAVPCICMEPPSVSALFPLLVLDGSYPIVNADDGFGTNSTVEFKLCAVTMTEEAMANDVTWSLSVFRVSIP